MNHILIVASGDFLLPSLNQFLTTDNYSFQLVTNNETALKHLESNETDCIMSNLENAQSSFTNLFRQLKVHSRFKYIPIIAVVPDFSSELAINALDAGADDYCLINTDVRLITSKIKAHIRNKNLSLELNRLQKVAGIRQIVATYNHEFSNPLTIAIGSIGRLFGTNLNPNQEKYLGNIRDALERMATVIKKIRDLREYLDEPYSKTDVKINIDKAS